MKLRLFLAFFIISFQIIILIVLTYNREREISSNPTFRLKCSFNNSRDLLKGNYVGVSFKFNLKIGEEVTREDFLKIRSNYSANKKIWITFISDEESPFYRLKNIQEQKPLSIKKDEYIVCIQKYEIITSIKDIEEISPCELSFFSKIFLPENKSKPYKFIKNEDLVAECFIRDDGSFAIKALYVGNVPYLEYVDLRESSK